MALFLGLKVDSDALPRDLVAQIQAGKVDLDSTATTVALIRAKAVLGVIGFFDDGGTLKSMGIQCALCHSNVDNFVTPGIGGGPLNLSAAEESDLIQYLLSL